MNFQFNSLHTTAISKINLITSCSWQVLQLFPQLQPLVAAMGWDLLAGKIAARRKLMQLLWTSKSQVLRLEESSLYGNKSDEVFFIFHVSKCALWVLNKWRGGMLVKNLI